MNVYRLCILHKSSSSITFIAHSKISIFSTIQHTILETVLNSMRYVNCMLF